MISRKELEQKLMESTPQPDKVNYANEFPEGSIFESELTKELRLLQKKFSPDYIKDAGTLDHMRVWERRLTRNAFDWAKKYDHPKKGGNSNKCDMIINNLEDIKGLGENELLLELNFLCLIYPCFLLVLGFLVILLYVKSKKSTKF